MMRVRLLPVVIFVAALLVSVRVGHLVSGIDDGKGTAFGVAETRAQTGGAQTGGDKTGGDKTGGAKTGGAKTGGAKTEADEGGAAKTATRAPDPHGDAKAADAKAAAESKDKAEADAPPGLKDPNLFSAAEIQMLQRLAERRDELDARERSLAEREKLLKAFESRIEGQLAALKDSQNKVQGLLKAYDEQEAEKMRSLVKIYETMKPADAARIFEKLDGKVLLEVLQQMKTAKSAPIFAAMNPVLAREMTQALAERSQLPREADKAGQIGQTTAAKDRRSQ